MRNALLTHPNAFYFVVSVKSVISLLAYHCAMALQLMSPYL